MQPPSSRMVIFFWAPMSVRLVPTCGKNHDAERKECTAVRAPTVTYTPPQLRPTARPASQGKQKQLPLGVRGHAQQGDGMGLEDDGDMRPMGEERKGLAGGWSPGTRQAQLCPLAGVSVLETPLSSLEDCPEHTVRPHRAFHLVGQVAKFASRKGDPF
jgi:hypothetical protein